MTIHLRPFTSSDTNFIESLIPRFSEFDLPAWRQKDEIDNVNFASLKKAMETPEPVSSSLLKMRQANAQASSISKLKPTISTGKKSPTSQTSPWIHLSKVRALDTSCSTKPRNGRASKVVLC